MKLKRRCEKKWEQVDRRIGGVWPHMCRRKKNHANQCVCDCGHSRRADAKIIHQEFYMEPMVAANA